MFREHYRSAHEPHVPALTDAVARILGASDNVTGIDSFDICDWLRERDRQLNLEVEASHPLGYMAPWLPSVFPDARFVITLRDPTSWIKSRLNYHYYKTPPEWQRYRELIWGRWHKGYHPEESKLEELGLYSLDAYLRQYDEQYRLLFSHLPEDRRIVIPTESLDLSGNRIAEFLQINPTSLRSRRDNAFPCEESIIDLLPPDFVAWRIEETCGWVRSYL